MASRARRDEFANETDGFVRCSAASEITTKLCEARRAGLNL